MNKLFWQLVGLAFLTGLQDKELTPLRRNVFVRAVSAGKTFEEAMDLVECWEGTRGCPQPKQSIAV